MKYGTTLIVIAVLNVLVIFSGIPTGWKKVVIIATALVIAFVGWVLRAAAARKRQRAMQRAQGLEQELPDDFNAVADLVAHDVANRVEHEIDRIQGQR